MQFVNALKRTGDTAVIFGLGSGLLIVEALRAAQEPQKFMRLGVSSERQAESRKLGAIVVRQKKGIVRSHPSVLPVGGADVSYEVTSGSSCLGQATYGCS